MHMSDLLSLRLVFCNRIQVSNLSLISPPPLRLDNIIPYHIIILKADKTFFFNLA